MLEEIAHNVKKRLIEMQTQPDLESPKPFQDDYFSPGLPFSQAGSP